MRPATCVRASLPMIGFVFSLMTSPVLPAQPTRTPGEPQWVTVRGEVRPAADPVPGPFTVELRGISGAVQNERASAVDGAFTFHSVPAGSYRLVVTDRAGSVLATQILVAEPNVRPVTVYVRPTKATEPASSSISVQRLAHKVPSRALKEFDKALREASRAHEDEAITHLVKAIEADPEYFEAHVNLGACWMRKQDFQQAAASFQKAVELDPASPIANGNLAAALISAGRAEDGEKAARRALGADPASAKIRYLLGYALTVLDRSPQEAIDNLRKAKDRIPAARIPLAHLLVLQGDHAGARAELEGYLDSGDQTSCERAQRGLGEIRAVTEQVARK